MISINERIKNIYIDAELVLPMYNVHPYFSLKNLGKKSALYTVKYSILKKRFLCSSAIQM